MHTVSLDRVIFLGGVIGWAQRKAWIPISHVYELLHIETVMQGSVYRSRVEMLEWAKIANHTYLVQAKRRFAEYRMEHIQAYLAKRQIRAATSNGPISKKRSI